jgi:hypothetical protein
MAAWGPRLRLYLTLIERVCYIAAELLFPVQYRS